MKLEFDQAAYLSVHLFVTSRCNLQCRHCYRADDVSGAIERERLSHLEFLDIIRLVNSHFDAEFELEGGEFFLLPEALDILRDAGRALRQRMVVTTNGVTEIDEAFFPYLRDLKAIRVSVESHLDVVQRDIRGVGLSEIEKTVARLAHAGTPLVLRATLVPSTLEIVSDYIGFFYAKGVRSFSFFEFQPLGRGKSFSSRYSVSQEALRKLLNTLLGLRFPEKLHEVKISLPSPREPLAVDFAGELIDNNWRVAISGIPAPSLAVNYDGMLSVCPWKTKETQLGWFHPSTFLLDLQRLYRENMLTHSCRHCSTVKLLYRKPEGN